VTRHKPVQQNYHATCTSAVYGSATGRQQGCINLVWWVLGMQHTSYHPSGAYNFEVAPGFVKNVATPLIKCDYQLLHD